MTSRVMTLRTGRGVVALALDTTGLRTHAAGASADPQPAPIRIPRPLAPAHHVAVERTTAGKRLLALLELAAAQGGVLSRRQLYAAGVTRAEVRAQVQAGRWTRIGTQSIALHSGPLTREGIWWSAVLEAGPRAYLDGTSALIASGLLHFTEDRIRVSVPRGVPVRRRRTPSLDIRQTRRWAPGDVVTAGVPRTRPGVAAVRGALWAASNAQAALILTMTVQQGLARPDQVARELLRIRRDKRRAYLHQVVNDIVGGVRSLGELRFVEGCRDRGLPLPDAQVLVRGTDGRYYLDFRWAIYRLVVEVDGIQHSWVTEVVADALRQNSVALTGDTVLRLPVLGLRVAADEFFVQVEAGLHRGGWRRGRAA